METPNRTNQNQTQKTLPSFGHIRLPNGYVIKYSVKDDVVHHLGGIVQKGTIIDCRPYISKAGLTFSGCLMTNAIYPPRGLYKIIGEPYFLLRSAKKITRNKDEMMKFMDNYRDYYKDDMLIYYDNYTIAMVLKKDCKKAPTIRVGEPLFKWTWERQIYIYKLDYEFNNPNETEIIENDNSIILRELNGITDVPLRGFRLSTFNKGYSAWILTAGTNKTIRILIDTDRATSYKTRDMPQLIRQDLELQPGLYLIIFHKD